MTLSENKAYCSSDEWVILGTHYLVDKSLF